MGCPWNVCLWLAQSQLILSIGSVTTVYHLVVIVSDTCFDGEHVVTFGAGSKTGYNTPCNHECFFRACDYSPSPPPLSVPDLHEQSRRIFSEPELCVALMLFLHRPL